MSVVWFLLGVLVGAAIAHLGRIPRASMTERAQQLKHAYWVGYQAGQRGKVS
jgi:hypothetical protein